jgi:hypothetical protein
MSARTLCLAAAALALAACSDPRPAIVDCNASAEARPVCGFQNPEDLALLPGGTLLVISQMGEMDGSEPGSLVFFELASDAITPAFAGTTDVLASSAGWVTPPARARRTRSSARTVSRSRAGPTARSSSSW